MMKKIESIEELEGKARELRITTLKMIHAAGSGHPGGSLSAADLLTAIYYRFMRFKADQPNWPERDRLILSKGHCCPILYAILADQGYFEKEKLMTLRKMGSILQGHPDRNKTPGIEVSSGSLGQGLSVAAGMALAGKIDKKPYKTYCMLGDGEFQEGSNYEALMAAAHFRIPNLVAILDYNQIQQCGMVKDIMHIDPVGEKVKAFGWKVYEIDGHDMGEIVMTLEKAQKDTQPVFIVAHTVKGKGVSFMELNKDFHGRAPSDAELHAALQELGTVTSTQHPAQGGVA